MYEEVLGAVCCLGLVVFFVGYLAGVATPRSSSVTPPTPERPAVNPLLQEAIAALKFLEGLRDRNRLSTADFDRLASLCREEIARLARRDRPLEPIFARSERVSNPPAVVEVVIPKVALPAPSVQGDPFSPSLPEPVAPSLSPVEPAAPPPVRLGLLMRTFMEENNIRWGELLSGLLIVGCSVGLVISLWNTLNAIPYFPALCFLLVTAGIHGAGVYTLERWRLKSTSRGLLLIAQFLIPLNILAAVAISQRRPVTDPLYGVAVVVGFLSFGAMTWSGGRRLVPWGWPWLSLTLLGTSAGQLLISRLVQPGLSTSRAALLFLLPAVAHTVAVAGMLRAAHRWPRFTVRRVSQGALILGLSVFAVSLPLGLFLARTGTWRLTLSQLSPLAALSILPLLAAGLLVGQRMTWPAHAVWRTWGTALAILAGLLLAGTVWSAWPIPSQLIALGLIVAVALGGFARLGRLPVLVVPAVAALALAALVGFHVAQGRLTWDGPVGPQSLSAVLLMGRSSFVLLCLGAGVFGLVPLLRVDRPLAGPLAISAVGLAGIGFAIAVYAGFVTGVDGDLMTWVFILCAVGAQVACVSGVRAAIQVAALERVIAWTAVALTAVACIHACVWNTVVQRFEQQLGWTAHPWILTWLIHATVLQVVQWAVRFRGAVLNRDATSNALSAGTLVPLTLCFPFIVFVDEGRFGLHALMTAWASGAVTSVAVVMVRVWKDIPTAPRQTDSTISPCGLLMAAAQGLGTWAVICLGIEICRRQPWWTGEYRDARLWLALTDVLAIWAIAWIGVRRLIARTETARALFAPKLLTVDRFLIGTLALVLLALLPTLAAPNLLAELGSLVTAAPSGPAAVERIVFTWSLATLAGVAIAASGFGRRHWDELRPEGFVAVACAIAAAGWGGMWPQLWGSATGLLVPAGSWPLWITALIVAGAVLLAVWERRAASLSLVVGLLPACLPALVACTWGSPQSSASMVRWGLVIYGTALFALDACRRRQPAATSGEINIPRLQRRLGVAAMAPLFVQAIVVADWLWQSTPAPTIAAAPAFTCGVFLTPIAIAILLLWRTSWLDRSPGLALVSSAVANAAVTLGFLMALGLASIRWMDGVRILELANWNGLCGAACALLWWLLRSRIGPATALAPGLDQGEAPDERPLGLPASSRSSAASHPAPASATRSAQGTRLQFSPMWLQLGLTVGLLTILIGWATAMIVLTPARLPASLTGLATPVAQLFLLLTGAVLLLHAWKREGHFVYHLVGAWAVALVVVIAAGASPYSTSSDWLSLHILIAGWTNWAMVAAAMACGLTWVALDRAKVEAAQRWHAWESWQRTGRLHGVDELPAGDDLAQAKPPGFAELLEQSWTSASEIARWWGTGIGLAAILLASRVLFSDPARPLWTVGPLLGLAIGAAALALRGRSQTYAYTSTRLVWLAVSAWSLRPWLGLGPPAGRVALTELVSSALVALALCGMFWLGVEIVWQRKFRLRFAARPKYPPVPHTAAVLGLATLGLAVLFSLEHRLKLEGAFAWFDPSQPIAWLELTLLSALLLASLWERTSKHAVPGLYAASLIAAAMALEPRGLLPSELGWWGMLILAGTALAWSMVWTARSGLVRLGAHMRAGAPRAGMHAFGKWMPRVVALQVAGAGALAVWAVLFFPDGLHRWGAAAAGAVAVMALAIWADRGRREPFADFAMLAAAVTGAVAGWAIGPISGGRWTWLPGSIRLLESLSVLTALGGLGLVRRLSPRSGWNPAARRISTASGAAAVATLLVVLAAEGAVFDPVRGVPISQSEIVSVTFVVLGLIAALVSLAVLPGPDPLRLSGRGRMAYVYAAEATAALLCLHLYLATPGLFRTHLLPWWPLIVMAIAFAGTGLGELFQRRGWSVLAEPLHRTGAFLPLVPALGFWVHASQTRHSTLLFVAGVLYVCLSLWRGSILYSAAAALAGNAGLWALWHERGVLWSDHPQVWLIPPALSVLIAAQLNRPKLTEAQLTSLRYSAVLALYLSSAGDMFIAGVGKTLYLPVILAVLSLAGAYAGMLLRVRAYLYAGTGFLVLSIVSMVSHAARAIDHVWPWWAFGIATGLGLLALLGMFEKRRNEMVEAFSQFQTWEA